MVARGVVLVGNLSVERALATRPKPLHETVADQRGSARGLRDPGLIVDLRRQQRPGPASKRRAINSSKCVSSRTQRPSMPAPTAIATMSAAAGRRLLPAGDLIDTIVQMTIVRLRGLIMPMVARHPSAIRIEPSPSSAITPRVGWASAMPSASDRRAPCCRACRPPRAVTRGIEIEVGVADAGHHRLSREPRRKAPGQIGAIEEPRGKRPRGDSLSQLPRRRGIAPVSNGDRMKATGLWVVNAA